MSDKKKSTKRTIKYLATRPSNTIIKTIIKESPDSVIKAICNAALNAERGDIHLSRNQKIIFKRFKKQISQLTSPFIPIANKRRVIQVGGGFFAAIPLLLSTVLSSIGSAFAARS